MKSLLNDYDKAMLEARERPVQAQKRYNEGLRLVRSDPILAGVKMYEAARLGHPKARSRFFGQSYFFLPKITPRILNLIPKNLSSEAIFQLGLRAIAGIGMRMNRKLAFACFEQAAKQGNLLAQVHLGDIFYHLGTVEPSKVREQFSLAAEKGDSYAQATMAWFCASGYGVPQDSTKAAGWYRLAAEQGNREAQANLAYMLVYSGKKTEQEEGMRWCRLAALQGSEIAKRLLARIHTGQYALEAINAQNAVLFRSDIIMEIPEAFIKLHRCAITCKDFPTRYHYAVARHTHKSPYAFLDTPADSPNLEALIKENPDEFLKLLMEDLEVRQFISKDYFNSLLPKIYENGAGLSDGHRNELYFRLADKAYDALSKTIKDQRHGLAEVEYIVKLLQEIPEGHPRYEDAQLPLEHCRFILEGSAGWVRGIALETQREENVDKFSGIGGLHTEHEYSSPNVRAVQARIRLEQLLERAKIIAQSLPLENRDKGVAAKIMQEVDRVNKRWVEAKATFEESLADEMAEQLYIEALSLNSVLSEENLNLLAEVSNTLNKADRIGDYLRQKMIPDYTEKFDEINRLQQAILDAFLSPQVDFNQINTAYLDAKTRGGVLSEENTTLQLQVIETLQKAEEIARNLNKKSVWNGAKKAKLIEGVLKPMRIALQNPDLSPAELKEHYLIVGEELKKALNWQRLGFFSSKTPTKSTRTMEKQNPHFMIPKKSG